jgi:dihydroflavonol-4-reductase
MILVTGSSGHIGNVLVRKLLERNENIRIMTKDGQIPTCLSGLPIEVFKGDLKDKVAVDNSVKGAEYVFHLGGIISISTYNSSELTAVNVGGTENIVNSCIQHGIKRLVYTSSVHALPEGDFGTPINEVNDFKKHKLFGAYARTKASATYKVLEGVENGLDAVICYPSGVIGPFDFRGSEAGRLIRDYATNKLPVYIDGEYNFVDVRDVAEGLISALNKGRKGQGYILGGHRMSLDQFFTILSEFEVKMKKPNYKIPVTIAIPTAWIVETFCLVFRIKPLFTVYAIKVLQSNCEISSEKAKKELDFKARSINESIRDGLSWLKENNKI